MQMRYTQIAQLGCRIVKGPQSPELVAVLAHGFGAPGSDLVPVTEELVELEPRLHGRVAFVFPEAPIELVEYGGGARAWWRIDLTRLERMAFATPEEWDARRDEVPEGLTDARRRLMALLSELSAQWKLSLGRFVLGGFSQGAMLATDVALRLEEPPAALALFSGTLIVRSDWTRRAAARRGLRVLMSHGRQDPLLPFSETVLLRELLEKAGLEVQFIPFDGAHTIALPALQQFASLLGSLLPLG